MRQFIYVFFFSQCKIKFYMSPSFIKFFDTNTTIEDFQWSGKCDLERFSVFGLKYVWCGELAYYFSEKVLTAQLPNLQNGWLCPIEYSPWVCCSQIPKKEPIPHLNICSPFSLSSLINIMCVDNISVLNLNVQQRGFWMLFGHYITIRHSIN